MPKRFIVFVVLLTVTIVGVLLYFVFRKQPQNIIQSQKPEKISSKSVSFPKLSENQNIILYYNSPEAVFYQININNKQEEALSDMLSFVESVSWSNEGTKVYLKARNIQAAKTESFFYSAGRPYEEITTWLYDLETKNKSALDKNFGIIAWSQDSKKIVYQYNDGKTNNLNIADPDGKNWKKITDIKENIVYLAALSESEIVYSATETTESFNVIKTDGSGKRIVKLPLSVSTNKIAWQEEGKSIIVAMRETGKSTDTFYKIDVQSGNKTEIKYSFSGAIDAKNLMLTKDGKTLYFTSDDFLYKMEM